jgi:YVTN family beta-propeller protein
LPLACTLCSDAAALRTVRIGLTPVVAAIDSSAGQVLVANFTGDSLSVLDTHSGRVLRTIAVGLYPSVLAVDPRTGEAFVANAGSNSVSIADTHTLRLMGTHRSRRRMVRSSNGSGTVHKILCVGRPRHELQAVSMEAPAEIAGGTTSAGPSVYWARVRSSPHLPRGPAPVVGEQGRAAQPTTTTARPSTGQQPDRRSALPGRRSIRLELPD